MSSDSEDRSPARAADEADASAEMEDRLEQLDKHIDDAAKKAEGGRPHGDSPTDDDVIDDAAGSGTDHDKHVDDPEGPLIE